MFYLLDINRFVIEYKFNVHYTMMDIIVEMKNDILCEKKSIFCESDHITLNKKKDFIRMK